MKVVIAIQECSAGNESVGSMWHEAQVFYPEEPLESVLEWAKRLPSGGGRLMITVSEMPPPDEKAAVES